MPNGITLLISMYIIATIWLIIPKLTKDVQIIKSIQIIMDVLYIFPLISIFVITFIKEKELLFIPLSHSLFFVPIFIYIMMIKLTFKKGGK